MDDEKRKSEQGLVDALCDGCRNTPFEPYYESMVQNQYRIEALKAAGQSGNSSFIEMCRLCPALQTIESYDYKSKIGDSTVQEASQLMDSEKYAEAEPLIKKAIKILRIEKGTESERNNQNYENFKKNLKKQNKNITEEEALESWVEKNIET
jgi:hypothetical protein